MGILGGMDIERIQSDINIHFYMQDIINNKVSGYVMPNDELFAKVFSRKEIYLSTSLMSALASTIGNPLVSDASREFFRQKALEYVDLWGGSSTLVSYMTRIFAGIGASLYSVKDKIPIDWAKYTGSNTNMFYSIPFFLYISGVISKTQWFRYKQGFVGANPDPILGLSYTLFTRYDTSGSNFTVMNTVGTGDDISEITLCCTNSFAVGSSYGVVSELGCDMRVSNTWGAGSKMRELSNTHLNTAFTNKNLVKLMIPKYREYLAPTGTNTEANSFSYKIDTEASLIYQPSIIEFAGIKTSSLNPSVPQTKLQFFSSSATISPFGARVLTSGSTAQIYVLRDCDWGGTKQVRAGIAADGSQVPLSAGFAYVPVMFDMQLPMWCM